MGYTVFIKKDRLDDNDKNLKLQLIEEFAINKKDNEFDISLKTKLELNRDEIYIVAIIFTKNEVINAPVQITSIMRGNGEMRTYTGRFIGLSKDDIMLLNSHLALGDIPKDISSVNI